MKYPSKRYTGAKPWMNKDWLYNEYVTKNRSSQEIADEYGCVQNTIQCWLLKHHIKKDINKTKKHPQYTEYEYLYEQYVKLKKDINSIEDYEVSLLDNRLDVIKKKTIKQSSI